MKKTAMLLLSALLILSVVLLGCTKNETGNTMDITGTYHGTAKFTKVDIVYDYDVDANGQEIRKYYAPVGESDWLGHSVEATYQVQKNEENIVTITSVNKDSDDNEAFKGSYDIAKGEFVYEADDKYGKNAVIFRFSKTENTIAAKGTIFFTHTETGLKSEITLELTKSTSS